MQFDCFVRKDGNRGKQIEDFHLTCIEDFSGISSIHFLIVTIYDTSISMAVMQNSQVGATLTPFNV